MFRDAPTLFRSGLALRLRLAFLFVAVGALLSFILYILSWRLGYLGLGSALLLTAIVLGSAIKHSDTIDEVKDALRRLALGHYDYRLYTAGLGEPAIVSRAFNETASAVEARFARLSQKVSEQDAVLASMKEGVIAVDSEEKIIRINDSACALIGIRQEDAVGRSVQEIVRDSDLLRFISSVHLSREPVESDITLREREERILHVYGKTLRDAQWNTIGILVVFSDITRLRHLENVRRDFVANVSHELRTPITSIKGFIETLQEGAIDNPADARRFLDILARQADRLNAIFDDLLTLSRIEEGGVREQIRLEPGSVITVVMAALEACAPRAVQRKIRIQTQFPEKAIVRLNENLLEQAMINLIDNAIKYSDEGSEVLVKVHQQGGEVHVDVQDRGPGIEKAHLPRLFERFYRVDKARTRKEGGTGLGLAIVKHIAECHAGKATVQSIPGQGSTFSMVLPAHEEEQHQTVH